MSLKFFVKFFAALFLLFHLVGGADLAESAPKLRLAPNNLPDGTQYEPYSRTLTGNQGTPPYSWSVTGTLPPGLTFNPAPSPSLTAVLSGTPSQPGTYTFTVTLTDSGSPVDTDSNTYTITISQGNCFFNGTNIGSISFNIIDPSTTPGPIFGTVTQQINFTCKATFPYTIAANPASGWTMDAGANTIPYTLGFVASGVGTGAPVALLSNTTQIIQTDYMNARAGLYSNTQPISFTISWTGGPGGGGSIVASLPGGSVNGTVINTCVVSQSPGSLTFNIDPSVVGTTSATISPDMQIKCTMNDNVVITASSACGGAAPKMAAGYPPACGADTIPYTFNFLSSITGQGFGGTGISLGLGGSAASADYANAPVGNYGDQQTLTITY